MTLMKYSLELSDPWISQYHGYNEHGGMETYKERKDLRRLWLTDDDNELRKLMLIGNTMDNLQGWR